MNIIRFIKRQLYNAIFRLTSHGISLSGKGIVKRINCFNQGKNNVAIIDAGASLENCSFFFKGNNNILHVSCGTHLSNVSFHFEDDDNRIEIGECVTSEPGLLLAACEGCSITIGEDCMFSNNVQVRTTDSHSIFDAKGRVNKGADIMIGKHVWIGLESLILKGVQIPDNSVVGARSMVMASLKAKPNSMIAGTPAKVIKEDVTWSRERL